METSPLKKQITPQEGFENGFLLPITSRSRSKSKNPRKKCRFTVNLEACVNSESKEDGFVALTESMAMRTCPICKIFSSASNTTLNVHIDRCLCAEFRQQFSKPNRCRVKPHKVKLMTDIYASARRCTLEDLDKRNGTKWASVSSFSNQVVTDKSQVLNKEKNQRLLSVGRAETEPVNIDAKGQKLRILSEFREKASTQTRVDEVIKGNDVLDNTKDTDAVFKSMIYEKLSCNSAEIESESVQGSSSLMEFDPIPIPGPPGSFLLSPWDIITDENLENSSSQIQSSQDQLDFTDKNSSESPLSAFSDTRLSTNSNLNTILSISDTILDQDLDLLSKSLSLVPAIPSNPVLRLMGKDLMIINQEESNRS